MRPELEDLREKLLRAGVKPGIVRRYLAELYDHFDDLLLQEKPDMAMRRLGSVDTLASAVTRQAGVRSWTARAPWATLTLGPLLALVLGCVIPAGILFLGVRAFAADLDYGHSAVPGTWPHAVLEIIYGFNQHLLPILVGWAAVALAFRQRAGMGWLLAGAVLTAILGGGLFQQVDWSTGYPAGVRFGIGFELAPLFTTFWGRSVETGILNLIVILAPYAVLRARDARSA